MVILHTPQISKLSAWESPDQLWGGYFMGLAHTAVPMIYVLVLSNISSIHAFTPLKLYAFNILPHFNKAPRTVAQALHHQLAMVQRYEANQT